MKQIINRIEFWIILFLLIRLIGITNPPLEIAHNWRQATGLMVSRNFLESDSKIFYPRIDENNGKTGIIGMEFPVMNYVYYLVSKVFGYTHWYGRLINLLISSLGLLYFYKIIILFGFSKKHAFSSTIFLAASIWFAFSRKMMPDTFSISLVIIGFFYGMKFLRNEKISHLIAFTLITSIAVLSKIPAGIYFVILIPLLLSKAYSLKSKLILAFSALIPIALTYYWYFIWNPFLVKEFGNWYNIGKPLMIGFFEIIENPDKTLKNFYFNSFSSYFMFSLFIFGILLMFIKKENRIISIFFLFFLAFVVFVFKSGFNFYHHNYYIIPFVPIMAFVAGYAASLVNKPWLFATILLIGVTEGIANQQHDFFVKESEMYKMSLEGIMNQISEKDDLIVINGNGNPQLLYLSHRKGWNCNNDQLFDSLYISDVIKQGCKFIVINKHTEKGARFDYELVFENNDFFIHKTIPGQSGNSDE